KYRRLSTCERLTRTLCDSGARCVRLEATVVAAFAATSRRIDGRMANLTGDVRCTMEQASVENESAADACTNRYANDVTRTFRCTTPPLAERRAIRVVVERRWQSHAIRDFIAQREIFPTEVWRDDHDPALSIERAG